MGRRKQRGTDRDREREGGKETERQRQRQREAERVASLGDNTGLGKLPSVVVFRCRARIKMQNRMLPFSKYYHFYSLIN